MQKIDETGDLARKEGSGRPNSVRLEENIKLVEEMIFGQENQPGTRSTPSEISLNIDRWSMSCTIDEDLDLHPLKKCKVQKLTDSNIEKRMIRSRKLVSKYT